jgi:hypothetical protein
LSANEQTLGEKVSFNSKAVLLGLFALVGFILLIYTFSVLTYDPEQTGRFSSVFIAAISGSLALGGTLITQLWGRGDDRPLVYSTSPMNSGVSRNTIVTASFNKLMDEATINTKTFTLKDGKNAMVAGDVTLEGGRAIFRLKAGDLLKANTTYTATITKDAKDITGNSLQADKVWTFTTGGEDGAPVGPSDKLPKADDAKDIKTTVNTPVPIQLKATHPDNKPLSFVKVLGPTNGEVTGFPSSNGKVTYKPKDDYSGSDSFTFKATDTDSKVDSNVATVNITITKPPSTLA